MLNGDSDEVSHGTRGLHWALADQLVASGSNFITTVILARAMSLETFGLYSMFWLIFLLLQTLQIALIVSPMMVQVPKLDRRERVSYISRASGQQLLFSVITLMVSAVVHFFIFGNFLIAVCFSIWLSTQLLCEYFRRLQFTKNRLRTAFWGDVLRYAIQSALLIGIGAVLPGDLGLSFAFLSVIAGSVVGALFMTRGAPSPVLNPRAIWQLTRNNYPLSKWLVGAAVLQWTSGHFFVLATGVLLSPVAVTALRVSQTLLGITNILFQSAENVLLPRASRTLKVAGHDGLKHFALSLFGLTVGGTAVICLVMAALAPTLLTLVFGNDYSDYAFVLRWLCLSYLSTSACISLRIPLKAAGRTRPIFLSVAASTAFTLFSFYPLISYLDLPGALTGIIVADTIVAIILLRFNLSGRQLYRE